MKDLHGLLTRIRDAVGLSRIWLELDGIGALGFYGIFPSGIGVSLHAKVWIPPHDLKEVNAHHVIEELKLSKKAALSEHLRNLEVSEENS